MSVSWSGRHSHRVQGIGQIGARSRVLLRRVAPIGLRGRRVCGWRRGCRSSVDRSSISPQLLQELLHLVHLDPAEMSQTTFLLKNKSTILKAFTLMGSVIPCTSSGSRPRLRLLLRVDRRSARSPPLPRRGRPAVGPAWYPARSGCQHWSN